MATMDGYRSENQGRGVALWFTGLPCSGKSTVSELVAQRLRSWGSRVELLDGDVVRQNLTKGLGFSKGDRDENIRRIGFVCHLLTRNGVIAISAAISPYRAVREEVRGVIGSFLEIYVDCPLEVCIQRDVKGMYKKALAGDLPYFTGISDPYEGPLKPDLVLYTHEETPEESARKVLNLLVASGYLPGEILAPQRPAELAGEDGLRFTTGRERASVGAEEQ
jgi:adenylylsulfate kinase